MSLFLSYEADQGSSRNAKRPLVDQEPLTST